MAEQEAQFDDELLSAYLDDELSAEERAHVEERLSADPAARQLLEELRSVSQAMRGLPHAKLGRDLRDSVLRRAEREMLVAGKAKSAKEPEQVAHPLPFGRSKRAWFWAGAAIAAGLMLMFIEREAPRDAELPKEVALNRPRPQSPEGPLPPLAMRAIEAKDETTDAPTLGEPVAAAPVAPATDWSADRVATLESPAAGEAGAPLDHVAGSTESLTRGGIGGGAGGFRGERFVEAADGSQLLVVHVSVTPEAMRNRAFDATLLNNRIEVEAETEELSDQPSSGQDLEVVVVEAAPAQVYSTLAEIQRDTKNYVGIAVEEQSVGRQVGPAKAKLQAVEENVRRYNRGHVSNQQQVQLSPDYRNFYYAPQQTARYQQPQFAESSPKSEDASSIAATPPADESQLTASSAATSQSESLALGRDKLEAVSAAERPPAQSSASGRLQYYGAELLDRSKQNVARRATQKLSAKADMLQVLFVLQADEKSPAAATSSAVSTSEAAPVPALEEGLKADE